MFGYMTTEIDTVEMKEAQEIEAEGAYSLLHLICMIVEPCKIL